VTTEKSVGVTLEMTKREAGLTFGLMKMAFELQVEGQFPMSNESLVELIPVWESIAHKIDKLNGVSQFNV